MKGLGRYFGGENAKEALRKARALNKKGMACSLAFLPVKKTTQKEVNAEVREYKNLIDSITERRSRCDVTVKLHQFGFYGSKDLAEKNISKVVKYADQNGIFVWLDMEKKKTVPATIKIFQNLRKKHNNVGICLQSYLKRSEKDMKKLLKDRVPIRLVKGFYNEHDFDTWKKVTANYDRLMEYLIPNSDYPAIATHDRSLISRAKKIKGKNKIKTMEFQFFMGACDDLAEKLVKQGYKVRMYIPYGNLLGFIASGITTFDIPREIERLIGVREIV